MKSKVIVSEDGTKLVATYELNAINRNRTGALKPWVLSPLIAYSGIQQSDVYIPGYLETVTNYTRYHEFYLRPELYTKVKHNSTIGIEIVFGVGYVGKTSWVCEGQVRLAKTLDVLCHFNSQSVNVDMSTHQPTALPENLRRKGKGPRPTFSLPVSPEIPPMYSHKFRVGESDIDGNGHTNQSAYIRLCSDTAAFGTKASRYTSLSGNFLKYPIKKIAILFLKEAFLEDTLEVQSWEIPSKPVSLLFQVKRGEDDIVRCLFELYEQEKAKL